MTEHQKYTIAEYGAAEEVPGSKLMLELPWAKILTDLGSSYTRKESQDPESVVLPFDPRSLDALVLTHAHGDHVGQMLLAYIRGMTCPIFSTYQTGEITELQHRQTVSAPFIHNKMVKGKKDSKTGRLIPFKKMPYSSGDLAGLMSLFRHFSPEQVGMPYETPFRVVDGVEATFYEAGHIPGSAQILYRIKQHSGKDISLLTCVDLGRTDYKVSSHNIADTPIVKFPYKDFNRTIDFVVIEATYGGKTHRNIDESIEVLQRSAYDAAKRKGKLIIPAFSIMRTHMLWNFLFRLDAEGNLPKDMNFYTSSPSADDVSKVIIKHTEDFDEMAKREFRKRHYNPFLFDRLVHLKTAKETMELMKKVSIPMGFIASSGMCDFGRIVNILYKGISDPRNIVLLTGYSSPTSRAHMLLTGYEKAKAGEKVMIPFYENPVQLRAEVRRMGGLSGHADADEMIAHLRYIDPDRKLKKIFIKHGEKQQCEALRQKIMKELGYQGFRVVVMKKGERYSLDIDAEGLPMAA